MAVTLLGMLDDSQLLRPFLAGGSWSNWPRPLAYIQLFLDSARR
jgi:hypothetical protein